MLFCRPMGSWMSRELRIPIGTLRHRLTLESPPTNTSDGDGGYTQAWPALSPGTVWGSVEPADGRAEKLVANVVEGVVTHIVTMRYHSGVTTKTRITHKGRYL